jgi:hypothetical protein
LADNGNRQRLEVCAYETAIVVLVLIRVAVAVIPGRGSLDGDFPVEVEVLDMSTILGKDTWSQYLSCPEASAASESRVLRIRGQACSESSMVCQRKGIKTLFQVRETWMQCR